VHCLLLFFFRLKLPGSGAPGTPDNKNIRGVKPYKQGTCSGLWAYCLKVFALFGCLCVKMLMWKFQERVQAARFFLLPFSAPVGSFASFQELTTFLFRSDPRQNRRRARFFGPKIEALRFARAQNLPSHHRKKAHFRLRIAQKFGH